MTRAISAGYLKTRLALTIKRNYRKNEGVTFRLSVFTQTGHIGNRLKLNACPWLLLTIPFYAYENIKKY